MICIFLIEDKYKKEKMPGLLPKYTCKVSRIIIFPLKHIKHKIIILTHVYEKTEVWTLRGTTRPHFLFQSWYPFPTENSTGVQCLRTSGKFGCAWACKEVFLLSVFSRISKQTLERTISRIEHRICREFGKAQTLLVSFSGAAVNLQNWAKLIKVKW